MHSSLTQGSPTSTPTRRHVVIGVVALTLVCAASASAQKITTVEGLTLEQTLVQLANPLGARPIGESIGLATAIEIGTAPFGTSSGGFVFKLDPATGTLARTTTTFGPSFTERALTAGEGQVIIGATFSSTNYDKLSKFALNNLPLGSVTASTPAASRTGTGDFRMSSKTLAISGTVGVTPKVDVGVIVPLVSIKLEATTSLVSGTGTVVRLAETNGVYSGIGDIAAIVKFKLAKFKGPDVPDPGGLALMLNTRLPTGDRDNLRGLGVTRTMAALVFSAGKGKLRPHATAGFDFWSKSVDIPTATATGGLIKVRHQTHVAGGVEVEATPKVTLLLDFIGQKTRNGGEVGIVSDPVPANSAGISAVQSLVTLPEGILRGLLVPGIKVNLKGKLLLSLNAIITTKNNGLHSRVTPVVGLNLTM